MTYLKSPTTVTYEAPFSESSYTGRRSGHPFWRVAQVEQLGLLQALALLLPVGGAAIATDPAAAAGPRDDGDLLDVRRVDKELHLDARTLHHVPKDERRVGPAASHRDEHAGEGGRRVREVDGEHGARSDAVWVRL